MRPVLIVLAAALLVPATASAAPFEELPFQTLPGGTTCFRPTGTPGELVAWAHGGASLLSAGASGLAATTVALGDTNTCPTAATQANGAGVLAAATSAGISVALREPGGATWAAPVQLPLPKDSDVQSVTAAVSERGDALVIWAETVFQRRGSLLRLRAARRPAGGAFGAPQTLTTSDSPFFNAAAQAGIAADGTAIVAWSHFEGREQDPHSVADLAIAAPGAPFGAGQPAAHAATVSADDSYATQVVSGPLRDADSIAAIVLPNGVPAVAWSDNGGTDGRAHLAAEGVTRAPRPAPQVHVGRPEHTALRRTQELVVPVTCSAACDLRAMARGLTASASLTRAGTVKLRFGRQHVAAPPRAARVPITVLWGAPGARDAQSQVIRPRLRRIPDPPLPRVLDLAAIRSGSTVTVTWRLNRSGRRVEFVAYSSATRDGEPGPSAFVDGSSKSAVKATLRHVPASHKYVTVRWSRGGGHTRHASVRIR